MMSELTTRQFDVLAYICDCIFENMLPPTLMDVALRFDINPNAASDHIKALEKKGFVTRIPRVSRGLRLTPKTETFMRPEQ